MSFDVQLKLTDFKNIIGWFEMSFGKQNNPSTSDRNTFTKLSAMALAVAEEEAVIKDDNTEDPA